MRLTIVTPTPLTDVSGPSTVARELQAALIARGDQVEATTFSEFERSLPVGFRQLALFVRLVFGSRPDLFFLLDPASTGPAVVLAAKMRGVPSVLRVGGDFVWEAWVARKKEPVLLSEFYDEPRALSFREKVIDFGTRITCALISEIIFTTKWQQKLWEGPYKLSGKRVSIISNGLPEEEPHESFDDVTFLCAGRATFLKNMEIVEKLWPKIQAQYPNAKLDRAARPPAEYRKAQQRTYAIIIPSLSEVSPNAVLEAIALGKPFVTTKDTGIYDEYHDAGYFIDTRDEDALTAAILDLLTPVGYAKAKERALTHAKRRPWRAVAEEFRTAFTAHLP